MLGIGPHSRYLFIYDGFLCTMAQTTADLHKDVPFLGFVDIAPHLGGKSPQNPNFGGVNRRFQAKIVKSINIAYCNLSDVTFGAPVKTALQ